MRCSTKKIISLHILSSNNINIQLIYGRNPVVEAIQEGKKFERIFVKDTMTGEVEKEIRSLCKENDITLKKVPLIKLDKLSKMRNHQGIVGMMSLIQYQELDDIIPFLFEQGKSPVIVVLDNIQDIGNVGAIARSSEVLGAHAIVLSGKHSAVINEDAIKTSAGALYRIPVCKSKNTLQIIDTLHTYGIAAVGSSLVTENGLEGNLKGPLAVILGSEFDGLHSTIEEKCDRLVKIPQIGSMDSLNVSVSAGIILYEILKQNQ